MVRIECPNCHKVYGIPDKRLDGKKHFTFPCPACEGFIIIDLGSDSKNGSYRLAFKAKEKEPIKKDAPSAPSTEEQPFGRDLKKRIFLTLGDLPPMPQVVLKAQEIVANPNLGVKHLADIIETDQAIVVKILKLANSAYYGLAGKVSSIRHAASLLGLKTLNEIITMAGTSNLLGEKLEGYGLDSGDLWRHSLAVAFGSKIIVTKINPELINDAFITGLLHDTGKLILDQPISDRKEAFDEFMADGKHTFLRAEKEILGLDHSEIAFEACKSWGIPEAITTAIKYHHYPSRSHDNKLAYVVHIADSLAMMSGVGTGIDGMSYEIDGKAVEFIGLKEEALNNIMFEAMESVKKVEEEMKGA
ncbi:MAG: HDOD domain-containing protein [Deltaproteobacteria bacterium]|nr:HDOD domain-containing protein [Deltaproteobacteria bacterium]MBW1726575.1 HDOD domain-containing protein [Deltaproteobacteria bacterium]MBW1908482.1 HDOD domain-containing protein [Deltaproteobacteria bacterium]MBW2032888.1 HDOD domain-containing protein [Deltaproteobacteria bacterium]MBW2113869.1 HDOD domain-containing protein [Deltaproteobacteria bacterium]